MVGPAFFSWSHRRATSAVGRVGSVSLSDADALDDASTWGSPHLRSNTRSTPAPTAVPRIRCVSPGVWTLLFLTSCGDGQLMINPLRFAEPSEGLGGHAAFARVCPAPSVFSVSHEDPILAKVGSVDFDLQMRVLVTDPMESRVFVWGNDGKMITSFGRRGRGPGEFRALADAVFLEDGRIVTLDRTGSLSWFTTAGDLIAGPRTGFAIGDALAVSDTTLLVGITSPGILGLSVPPLRVREVSASTGRMLSAFAPEDIGRSSQVRHLRLVRLSASGGVIAVANQYEPLVELYDEHGARVRAWAGMNESFRPAEPPRRHFRSTRDFLEWATSSSHVLSIGVVARHRLLVSWDRFDDPTRRRLYLTAYALDADSVVLSAEIPYRMVRVHGDLVAFLDATDPPAYRVLICRWPNPT